MSAGKVLLGLLAGIAVGATVGVLFAPDKGTATRKKISNKRDNYVEELEEKFNSLIDGATEKFESAKAEAARMAKNGKAKMDEIETKISAAAHS